MTPTRSPLRDRHRDGWVTSLAVPKGTFMSIFKLGCGSFAELPDDGSATAEAALARIDAQLAGVARDEAKANSKRAKVVDALRAKLDRLAEKAGDEARSDAEIELDAEDAAERIAAAERDGEAGGRVTAAVRARLERDRADIAANGVRQYCPVCLKLYTVTGPVPASDTEKPGAGCQVGPPSSQTGTGPKGGK